MQKFPHCDLELFFFYPHKHRNTRMRKHMCTELRNINNAPCVYLVLIVQKCLLYCLTDHKASQVRLEAL